MKKKKLLLCLLPLILLVGCNSTSTDSGNNTDSKDNTTDKTDTDSNTSYDNEEEKVEEEDEIDIEKDFDDQTEEDIEEDEDNTIDVSTIESAGQYKISDGGTYVITGSNEDARIVVDSEEDVKLILNNLTLTSLTDAPIEVKGAKSIEIYIPSATKNTIADSENNTLEAAIIVKKVPLNITGEGYLYVSGNGLSTDTIDSGVAIQAAKGLNILNTHLIVTSSNSHALNSKAGVEITNAKLTLTSLKDAIHSKEGGLTIEDSTINFDTHGDGVDALTDVTIKNTNAHIVTHGDFVKYNSSDDTDGTLYDDSRYVVDGSYYKKVGKDEMTRYNTRYYLNQKCKGVKSEGKVTIDGGDYYFSTDDDSIASDTQVDLLDGEFRFYTLDQAINSEQTLNIGAEGNTENHDSFKITIFNAFEGIQGAYINFYDGYTYIVSSDDGINASSDTVSDVSMNFYSYSTVVINSGTDGVDSNGSITLDGGNLFVFGPSSGGDSSLDFDKTFNYISGDLFAFSQTGMIETPNTDKMNVLSLNLGSYSANDMITVLFDDYEYSAILPKAYSSMNVIVGGSKVVTGKTATILKGAKSTATFKNNFYVGENVSTDGSEILTIEVKSGLTSYGSGNNQGGGGDQPGGNPGGNPGDGGNRPGDGGNSGPGGDNGKPGN